MSQSQSHSEALGARGNWWGETPVDDLRDQDVAELTTAECKRLIEAEIEYNVPTDRMAECEIREYIRDMRRDDDSPQPCVSAYEIAEWKAHNILRQVSDKHSKTAKHAPPYVCPISSTTESDRLCTLTAWLWGGDADKIASSDRMAMHSERCEVELTSPELHLGKIHGDGQFALFEYGSFRYRKRFDPEHGYIGGVDLNDLPPWKFLQTVEIVLANAKEEKHFRDERLDEWLDVAKQLKQDQDQSDQDALTEVLRRVYLSTND